MWQSSCLPLCGNHPNCHNVAVAPCAYGIPLHLWHPPRIHNAPSESLSALLPACPDCSSKKPKAHCALTSVFGNYLISGNAPPPLFSPDMERVLAQSCPFFLKAPLTFPAPGLESVPTPGLSRYLRAEWWIGPIPLAGIADLLTLSTLNHCTVDQASLHNREASM